MLTELIEWLFTFVYHFRKCHFIVHFGCLVLLIFFTFYLLLFRGNRGNEKNPPPLMRGLPVVGYLPFLGKEAYKTLHYLSEKHGNVFGLYLGRSYVVMLADFEAVKDAFSRSETTDRPQATFSYIPNGVGFSSVNGEEWAEQRKYCLKAMRDLGLGKSDWESLLQEEVEDVVERVSRFEGRPVDITKLLTASSANNISTLVFGRRCPLDEVTIDTLNDAITAVSQFSAQISLRSAFPEIVDLLAKWGITGYAKNLKLAAGYSEYIMNQVDNHRKSDRNSNNFIDDYVQKIKENKENNLGNSFTETNLYGNVNALFFASTETTTSSILWLLLIMSTYQDVQDKVQAELDRVTGRECKRIDWQDRTSVPYTHAVIMEGQRWRTIAPFNTLRVATEDIKIGKYNIAKGTTIVANNWGLHHDRKYWKDPEQFFPERFLIEGGSKINFKPDSYVPFSYGKRNCPGDVVAMMAILFYFVTFMQRFRVQPPAGKATSLRGTLGLTFKPEPQELCFVARNRAHHQE